jgi:hypothetical protein
VSVIAMIAAQRRVSLVWQRRQGRYANVLDNYPAEGGVQKHHEAAMIDSFTVAHVIGNPLVAQTMITHDPGVGLNVPIRVVIFQTSTDEVRLAYDLPSSLRSRRHNEDVSDAALELDAKLRALAELATGAVA